MRANLERRVATILGVTAALAWLAFELYVGLGVPRSSDDCGCEGGERPSEPAAEASGNRE